MVWYSRLYQQSLSFMARMFVPCVFLLVVISSGCESSQEKAVSPIKKPSELRIVVTSQPLLELTQAIAGDHAEVERVFPNGRTPRLWRPLRRDGQALQAASLILFSGSGYEPWKDRLSLPVSRIADTSAGYADLLITVPDAVTHRHGPEGEHSHAGLIWATWLDPDLLAAQVTSCRSALSRLLPDKDANFAATAAKLNARIVEITQRLKDLKTRVPSAEFRLLSDGPQALYLTRRLGCQLTYLHWDEDPELADHERQELAKAIQSNADARIFLMTGRASDVQEDFIRKSGLLPVRIDLCETAAKDLSVLDRLEANLDRLNTAMTDLELDPSAE
jgi:zinc transport system substrate-binding protein